MTGELECIHVPMGDVRSTHSCPPAYRKDCCKIIYACTHRECQWDTSFLRLRIVLHGDEAHEGNLAASRGNIEQAGPHEQKSILLHTCQ